MTVRFNEAKSVLRTSYAYNICIPCINVVALPPGAVVGLEETFYQVSEDVGVVEMCAIVYSPSITCPIEFPFNVSPTTSDGIAGNTPSMTSQHKC